MRYVCPTCDRSFTDEIGVCPDDATKLLAVQSKQANTLVGTTLDNRFRIDKMIGEGGMGAVYLGTQTSVDRQVAIKVIRAEFGHDAETVKRFYREAQIISRLHHSNIVHLVDFGQTKDGLLYLVMEYVKGRALTAEIAKGPMAVGRVQAIIGQVCDALAEAHMAGVVHRDLKPDNILLTSQAGTVDVVKILDFGIAKVASDGPAQASALTQAGAIMGTPQYMSPEQIDGKGEITPSADLYALAVIAFEMLAGVPPFHDAMAIALLIKHLKDVPPRVREVAPHVNLPHAMEDFLGKALAKDPADRSRDALSFKGDFAAVAAGLPVALQPAGDPDKGGPLAVGDVAAPSQPMPTLPGQAPGPVPTMMPAKADPALVAAPVASAVPAPNAAPANTAAFGVGHAAVAESAHTQILAPASLPSREMAAVKAPPRPAPRPAPRPHIAAAQVPVPPEVLAPVPDWLVRGKPTMMAAASPKVGRKSSLGLIAAGIGFVVVAALAALVATGAMQPAPPTAAAGPALEPTSAVVPAGAPVIAAPPVPVAPAPQAQVPFALPVQPTPAVAAPAPAAGVVTAPSADSGAVKKASKPAPDKGGKGKKSFNRDDLRLE